MQALWYHFAILFEALFILTAVDAGTRAGRFMIQDLLGHVYEPLGRIESIPANVIATLLCVGGWGYFVYQGTIDPLGGVNTIWPLFGIGNQMLAGIALLLATTVLIKMKREQYTWVTLVPTAWLLVCTLSAAWEKVMSSNPKIGFFALASKYSDAAAAGTVHRAGQDHCRHAARRVQQLPVRQHHHHVRRAGPRDGILHHQVLAAGAAQSEVDGG